MFETQCSKIRDLSLLGVLNPSVATRMRTYTRRQKSCNARAHSRELDHFKCGPVNDGLYSTNENISVDTSI